MYGELFFIKTSTILNTIKIILLSHSYKIDLKIEFK
jgi:hypothetical protein